MRPKRINYRNNLRQCRLRALVVSQAELARRTGICRTTLCALENNHLPLSIAYAMLIKKAIGCSLDELFQEISGDTPESTNGG